MSQLANLSPNVILDAGTPFSAGNALAAYIRGIGQNDFAFNLDPGVGIYVDGVYLARTVGANVSLKDVERVEILKGPQGTLFGRNSIGGAVSIITKDPQIGEFSYEGEVTAGSYDRMDVAGFANIPLTDSMAATVAFASNNRDGFMSRVRYPGINNYVVDSFESYLNGNLVESTKRFATNGYVATSINGVNVDADPTNDRLPYDDRFVHPDTDKTYATGNNYSKFEGYGMAAHYT